MTEKTTSKTASTAKSTTKTYDSDKIWGEICNLPIDIYALPNQKVGDHLTKAKIPGDNLLVKPKSPAVVPALELALGSGFLIEVAENGYLIISRASDGSDVDDVLRSKLFNS